MLVGLVAVPASAGVPTILERDVIHLQFGRQHPEVVLLELFTADENLVLTPAGSCSGTLINTGPPSPDNNQYISTAAHCVDTPAFITVNFGDTDLDIVETINAEAWWVPALWENDFSAGNDIGLIRMERPAISAQGLGLYRNTQGNEITQDIITVGYGLTGSGAIGSVLAGGEKRAGRNRIDSFFDGNPGILRYDFDVPQFFGFETPDPTGGYLGVIPPRTGSESFPIGAEMLIAPGDSGGPDLIEGDGLQVVGVHSFVIAPWDLVIDDTFTDESGSTRMASWADWYDRIINGDTSEALEGIPFVPIIDAAAAAAAAAFHAEQAAIELGWDAVPSFSGNRGYFKGWGAPLRTKTLGDPNGDGLVDLADIKAFIAALAAKGSPAVFDLNMPDGVDWIFWAADISGDGWVDPLDIGPFIDMLLASGAPPEAVAAAFAGVPEPATAVVMVLGALGLVCRSTRAGN